MAGTAIEQLDNLYSSISTFAKQKASAVQGGGFPNISAIVGGLDFSELNTLSNNLDNGAASFAAGVAADATNLSAAISREYTIRVRGKYEYYANSTSENTAESEYYDSLKYLRSGTLSGTTGNF